MADKELGDVGEVCDTAQTGVLEVGGKRYVMLRLLQDDRAVGLVVVGAETAAAIGLDLLQFAARPDITPKNMSIADLLGSAPVPARNVAPVATDASGKKLLN